MSNSYHRHSIRLKDYDYSKEGMYFVTICTQKKACLFGKIHNANNVQNVREGLVPVQIERTHFGRITESIYLTLENRYKNIKLHDYILMPNHIHGIIEICNIPSKSELTSTRAGTRPAPTTILDVVRDFKSLTTLEYIKGVNQNMYTPFNKRIWQRNYYEHVIRNEKELYIIQQYIIYNPLK